MERTWPDGCYLAGSQRRWHYKSRCERQPRLWLVSTITKSGGRTSRRTSATTTRTATRSCRSGRRRSRRWPGRARSCSPSPTTTTRASRSARRNSSAACFNRPASRCRAERTPEARRRIHPRASGSRIPWTHIKGKAVIVENSLHWALDVGFRENDSQVRSGSAPSGPKISRAGAPGRRQCALSLVCLHRLG